LGSWGQSLLYNRVESCIALDPSIRFLAMPSYLLSNVGADNASAGSSRFASCLPWKTRPFSLLNRLTLDENVDCGHCIPAL